MSDGIAELMSAVGVMNDKAKERSVAVQELTDKQAQAAQEQDDALAKDADSTKIIASAKLVADKKAEQQVATMATRMGTNPDESSSIMDKLADDWRTSSLNAIDKQSRLEKDLSINFFEHPGAFIGAQMRMEQTVKQADAAVHHRDNAAQALNQAQNLTQGSVVQANALKQTVTEATMSATLDKIDADLQGKRAALRMQTAGIQMDGLKTLNSMDITTINNLQAGVNAKLQVAQLASAQAHLRLAEQQAKQNLVEFNVRMDEKKATKEDMEYYADTVRKGAATMGIDLTGLGSTKIISLLNSKTEGFADYFNAGIRSQSTGNPTVADNAGETARVIAERNAPLRTEQSSIKKLFANSVATASSPQGAQGLGIDGTKKDQVYHGAGRYAVDQATKMQKNIDPTDGTNIYAAPPLEAVMKVPGLQNTPWFQTVMKPQMDAGGLKEFNPEQLVSLTAAAIKANKISFNDAAVGLQGAHTAAVRVNNVTKNYKGFGLPEQSSFNISLPNAYGILRHFDMATPQSVQQILSSKMNEDRVYKVDTTNPFRN